MQVIAQWTGGQADTLRQALRMTIEAFAERLEMSPRAVAYWRSHPEIVPRSHVQRTLDSMLERAPDRAKAQFALLIGETHSAQSGTESSNEPFEVPFDAMTSHEWNRDDAHALSLSFDAVLARAAVDEIEHLAHMWLLSEPPQVIELSAGRRVSDDLIATVERRVIQLRRADDYITGSTSHDLMRNELAATVQLLSEGSARWLNLGLGSQRTRGNSIKLRDTSAVAFWQRGRLATMLLRPTSFRLSVTKLPTMEIQVMPPCWRVLRIGVGGRAQRQSHVHYSLKG